MKIVISVNSCYRLPFNVVEKYFELSGLGKPYCYERTNAYISLKPTQYKLIDTPKYDEYIITTKDLGEECHNNEVFGDSYFDERDLERNDINLVKAVEELNPKNIKVIEIPDDVKWYIHETDTGSESIHEEHRIWY